MDDGQCGTYSRSLRTWLPDIRRKFQCPPAVVRLIGRFMFKRVLRKAAFPNGFYYLRLASVQFDIDAQKFYNIFTDLMTKSLQK